MIKVSEVFESIHKKKTNMFLNQINRKISINGQSIEDFLFENFLSKHIQWKLIEIF